MELEHVTFVTRAVGVIDLINNLNMASSQVHTAFNIFIAMYIVSMLMLNAQCSCRLLTRLLFS